MYSIDSYKNSVSKPLYCLIIVLCCFVQLAQANKWSQPSLTPRLHITDTISMIEVPFVSAGMHGDSCMWDFSNLRDSLPRDFLIATTKKDTTVYAITKVHTRYHYRMHNDSLWQTGYENNQMQMRYTNPILLATYPLAYQDTFKCSLQGKGEYCHALPTSVHGQITTCVDSRGRLQLPEATIDSVVRVHTIQRLCEHVGDTLLSIIEQYQWFCPQIPYPLLETIKIQKPIASDTLLYAAAYYYQYADTLRQHVDSIILPEVTDSVSMIFTEVQFLPNPVRDDLYVSYKLTQSAALHFSLHNNVGVVMYVSESEQQEVGRHSKIIPMGSYPQGTYVLYIHVDDIVLSETIIKP